MAQIKAKDLREKTDQELVDQMNLERKRLFDSTVKGAGGEAIKPHEQRNAGRLLARIQTILRERALRADLKKQENGLEAKTKGCSIHASRILKRKVNAQRARVKVKDLRRDSAASQADRAAIRLAEIRRLQAVLKRDDPGQGK